MARLNEEEALDNKLTLEGNENHRLTIIDQLDRAPKDQLCSKNYVLQLATHCCQVYDHWVNHPEEFSLGHEMRTNRGQTLLSLSHAMPAGHEKVTPKPDDLKFLDLREFSDWFLNHNSDISLRFNSVDALNKSINQRPETWFAFLRYLSYSLHYADLHIEAQSGEIENLRSTNEDLYSGPLPNTIDPNKKKRYRDEILRLRKNVQSLIKERNDLKSKLVNSIQEEADSDDEFLNRGADDVNNSCVISNPSSPILGHQPPTVKPELGNLLKRSTENINNSRPPGKMDVFDGENRDKYDEWVDKLLGQFRTHEDWFVNEDRKITYLMRHITSAPYHLLKGRYDERV